VKRVWCATALIAGLWCGSGPAAAATRTFTGVDGDIFATVRHGHTVYIGGDFTAAGAVTDGLSEVSPADGHLIWPPQPLALGNRTPTGVTGDGNGGWYAILDHETVVHVTATGAVDGSWHVSLAAPTPAFIALSGTVLVVAENPTGGTTAVIQGFAAGPHPRSVWVQAANGRVRALAATASEVFLAGSFSTVDGSSRAGLAALDTATGAVTPAFAPSLTGTPTRLALDPAGSTLYLAGTFTAIDGTARDGIAAVSTADSALDATFAPGGLRGKVTALAADTADVYIGGSFTKITGVTRQHLAALHRSDGSLDSLDMPVGADAYGHANVRALVVSGDVLYVVGTFGGVGGAVRREAAAIDLEGRAVTGWDPALHGDATAVAVEGPAVLLAGPFDLINLADRAGVAALDATTGALLPFDPALRHELDTPDGTVYSLAVHGSTLFVGGEFLRSTTQYLGGLAMIDRATAAVRRFRGPSLFVDAIAIARGVLYANSTDADQYSLGMPTSHIGAYSLSTHHRIAFDVSLDEHSTTGLTAAKGRLYVTGDFSHVNGLRRSGIAAYDAGTRRLLPWAPRLTNGRYDTVVANPVVAGEEVYLGGSFVTVDGLPRHNVAAVRVTDGSALSWSAKRVPDIYGIVVTAHSLYLDIDDPFAANPVRKVSRRTGKREPWAPTVPATPGGASVIDAYRGLVLACSGWWCAPLPAT
jgi:hypothetical protein